MFVRRGCYRSGRCGDVKVGMMAGLSGEKREKR
jgi:hypothetical protein